MAKERGKLTKVVLNAVSADGWSTEVDTSNLLWLAVAISTANSADGDIKVAGSHLPPGSVDFTSAAAVGNEWDYIALYNENDPSSVIVGSLGVQYAGTDSVEYVYVNTSNRNTVCIELANYVAGNFTVSVSGATNQ